MPVHVDHYSNIASDSQLENQCYGEEKSGARWGKSGQAQMDEWQLYIGPRFSAASTPHSDLQDLHRSQWH
jgi:hypothetical protein